MMISITMYDDHHYYDMDDNDHYEDNDDDDAIMRAQSAVFC